MMESAEILRSDTRPDDWFSQAYSAVEAVEVAGL